MSYENEPKSLDDYKDVIKILKLKIIKQTKRIQELQQKNKLFEDQINNVTLKGEEWQVTSRAMFELENESNQKKQQRQNELTTLKGKVDVMNAYVRGLKRVGISPQSVFRVADRQYTGCVESDHFRQVLSKMNIGLSQKQISCLIFVFDEFCSGIIVQADYYYTLHAYRVGTEHDNNGFIQQALFRLSQMLHNDKVNLIKFYEEMEGRTKRVVPNSNKKLIDLNVFEQHIKKYYHSRISEKELVAAFNAIDLESQAYLEKNNFMYCITSCINRLLSGDDGVSKKTLDWKNDKSQLSGQIDKASPKKTTSNLTNYNQSSKINTPNIINSGIKEPKEVKQPREGFVGKLQDLGLSLENLYEMILMDKFQHRLTSRTFKKCCADNSKVTYDVIGELFRSMDTDGKGSVYFNEIINYYLSNSLDNQMILRIFGKYFSVNDLDAEKFWFMFGLTAESQLSKNKFMELMKKTFETKEERTWDNFWGLFDKGRGSANVGNIVKLMKKYEIQ